jgi:Holliday junction resolvasome RuvABC endonuclease subunit
VGRKEHHRIMRVAAFDLSSKTGWAVWDGISKQPTLGTKEIVGWQYDAGTRLELYRKWLGAFIGAHRPQMIVIEGWFIAPHLDGATIGAQIGLCQFTQWAFKAAGVPCHLVTAGQWRKHWHGTAAGKGEWHKRKACEIATRLGWTYSDHNAAEAAGLLDYAICHIAKETTPWRDDWLLVGATS